MNGTLPLFDIFLHIRKGPSPIRAQSVFEAVEEASRMKHLEPFKVTDRQGNILLDENQLKAKIADLGG